MIQVTRPRLNRCLLRKPVFLLALLFLSASLTDHRPALFAADGTIVRGRVCGPDGAPVAGAELQLVDARVARLCPDLLIGSTANLWLAARPDRPVESASLTPRTARSNAAGQFEITAESADPRGILVVLAKGFAPHLEVMDRGKAQDVILERGDEVEIDLLVEQWKAAEEAEVTLVPLAVCGPVVESLADLLVRRARGDAEGKVVFHNVPRGTYALRVSAKGQLTSNLAPIVVRGGGLHLRLWIPSGRSVPGRVEFPSHTARSSGTVLAYWKDPEVGLQWTEASFSREEGEFVLKGIPYTKNVHLVAHTESGLSTGNPPLLEFSPTGGSLKSPILLRLPTDWHGRLAEEVAASSLIVEFLLSTPSPPGEVPDAIAVSVDKERRFVVPDVSPAVAGLRLIAPGYGEAQVNLEESSSGELGPIRFERKSILQGRAEWNEQSPLQGAEVEVLSASSAACRARLTRSGEFACPATAGAARDLRYRAWVGDTVFQLTPWPGKSLAIFNVIPGAPIEALVSRPGGRERVEDLELALETGPAVGDGLGSQRQSRRYARSPDGHLSVHVAGADKLKLSLSNPEGGSETSTRVDLASGAAERNLAVTLPAGPALFGTVKAAASGKAIEGAEIEIGALIYVDDAITVSQVSVTNGDGSWSQAGVEAGSYQITASAPGYAAAQKRVSIPRESGASQGLLLRRPGAIHGKVLGLEEGSVATLGVHSRSTAVRGTEYHPELDSKAEFTLDGLPPERYALSLQVKERASRKDLNAFTRRFATVVVQAGSVTEVEFDLRGGISLAGKAYLGMKPAKNASMSFRLRSKGNQNKFFATTPTGDEGQYEVHLPGPGSYLVSLYQKVPGAVGVDLDQRLVIGKESTRTQDLRFSDGEIRGRLLDSEGKPISGVKVHYVGPIAGGDAESENQPFQGGYSWHQSQEDGSFQLRPLAPGEYRLEVVAMGFASRKLGPVSLSRDQTVDLENVVLDPGLSVTLLAVGPDGSPLDRSEVLAYEEPVTNFSNVMVPNTTAETKDGLARIPFLSPGTYTFVGIYAGMPPAYLEDISVPLKEPEAPLTLQFALGGTLNVRIQRRNGEPVPDTFPQILDSRGREVTELYVALAFMTGHGFTDTGGQTILESVVPGEYSIKAGRGAKSDPRTVTVKAGQTTSVVLVTTEVDAD